MKENLHTCIARLALEHDAGPVGLVGIGHGLILLVTSRIGPTRTFAQKLAVETGRAVQLYDVARLPWTHAYHLSVEWLNGDPPRVPCARGAIARAIINGRPQTITLADLPHFVPVFPPPPILSMPPPIHVIPTPPVGGFLL